MAIDRVQLLQPAGSPTQPALEAEAAPATHAVLEVSGKSWLLAIGDAFKIERISLHQLEAADIRGVV